jgi:hypothetical protein
MPRFGVLVMLGLAACTLFDPGQEGAPGSGEMRDWRLTSGKMPSRAEYAAILAACRDGAVRHGAAATIDSCLADLGLKRAE